MIKNPVIDSPYHDACRRLGSSRVKEEGEATEISKTLSRLDKAKKFVKFVPISLAVANLSKDPSTQVGCVALDDNFNIRSVGYNGFPRGVLDGAERYNDRPTKYKLISHSEMNVVAQAARNGVSLDGCTLILTALYPCSTCTKLLIQAGFKTLLVPRVEMTENWEQEWEISKLMLDEAGVEVISYDPSNTTHVEVIM